MTSPWWSKHVKHILIFSILTFHFLYIEQTIVFTWLWIPCWWRFLLGFQIVLHAPILSYFAKLILNHLKVCVNKSSHICFQPWWSIHRSHSKSQLNVVFRIGANDEVDITPVRQQPSLDIAHHFWQISPIHLVQILCLCSWKEVSIQFLWVVNPPWS